jgi:hypothetical protein
MSNIYCTSPTVRISVWMLRFNLLKIVLSKLIQIVCGQETKELYIIDKETHYYFGYPLNIRVRGRTKALHLHYYWKSTRETTHINLRIRENY